MNELEKQIIIKGVINYPYATPRSEFKDWPSNVLMKTVETLMHSDPKIISGIGCFRESNELYNRK